MESVESVEPTPKRRGRPARNSVVAGTEKDVERYYLLYLPSFILLL